MASTIILSDNGVSSGSAGLKETGGNDGVLILQTTTSGGTATNAVYVDNTQKVGFGATPGTARVTIAAANAVTASRGTAYLYTTDSMAANLGGQISFGGSYTGTSETIFGAVAGRKENGTGADISGYLQLSTTNAGLGLVERMRIDSSGNVYMGTTTSSSITSSMTTLMLGGTNATVSGGIAYQVNGTVKGYDYVESNVRKLQTVSGIPISFNPAGVEMGRIDTSGWFLLGVTAVGNTWSGLDANNGIAFNPAYSAIQNSTNTNLYLSKKTGFTASAFIEFYVNGSAKGNINTNGTTVAYNTSSDYRLKENIAPMSGALAVVQQLKPCTYTWKEDGSDGQGFIAHELQAVVPDAVTGEKDAVDEDGNPKYQGIDTSFLVATLTAAIQEQQALITTLTERITALEAK